MSRARRREIVKPVPSGPLCEPGRIPPDGAPRSRSGLPDRNRGGVLAAKPGRSPTLVGELHRVGPHVDQDLQEPNAAGLDPDPGVDNAASQTPRAAPRRRAAPSPREPVPGTALNPRSVRTCGGSRAGGWGRPPCASGRRDPAAAPPLRPRPPSPGPSRERVRGAHHFGARLRPASRDPSMAPSVEGERVSIPVQDSSRLCRTEMVRTSAVPEAACAGAGSLFASAGIPL